MSGFDAKQFDFVLKTYLVQKYLATVNKKILLQKDFPFNVNY